MSFFKKLFSSNPEVSSKRFIGLVTVLIIWLIALVNLFTGKTVTDYIFEGLIWLAAIGIAGISSEKFADILKAKAGKSNDDYNENYNPDDNEDVDVDLNKNEVKKKKTKS